MDFGQGLLNGGCQSYAACPPGGTTLTGGTVPGKNALRRTMVVVYGVLRAMTCCGDGADSRIGEVINRMCPLHGMTIKVEVVYYAPYV